MQKSVENSINIGTPTKLLFIWKVETQGETELSHPFVHTPDAHSSQGGARPKLGAGNSPWVPHTEDRDPVTQAMVKRPPRVCTD